MPQCVNHPEIATDDVCVACRYPYCGSCLVEFLGSRYCGPCRDRMLAQMHGAQAPAPGPPTFGDHLIPTKNPPALIGYYLGVFSLAPCIGNFLGPAAVVLGILGLNARKKNPNLPGKAHAITAIVLGSLTSLLYWGGLAFLFLAR